MLVYAFEFLSASHVLAIVLHLLGRQVSADVLRGRHSLLRVSLSQTKYDSANLLRKTGTRCDLRLEYSVF